jgi:Tfp pilus assembly protein PilV
MKILIKDKNNDFRGFSLIEVLFSMGMFMLGIFAVASLMNGEIMKSINRRNEAIAGQLAQEGIELVRNIRDNNWINEDEPFNNIKNTGTIDYEDNESIRADGNSNIYLNNGGFYSHSNIGSQTIFRRRIVVDDSHDSVETITSIVTWGGQDPEIDGCDVSSKCFYTEVILDGTWGENVF